MASDNRGVALRVGGCWALIALASDSKPSPRRSYNGKAMLGTSKVGVNGVPPKTRPRRRTHYARCGLETRKSPRGLGLTAPAFSAYYGSQQLRSHVRYLPDPRRRV